MKEHSVKVIETIRRTPSAVSVRMEKPEGFNYHPGQWSQFTLGSNEGTESRPLSLSSSPTEDYLEFTKRITGSPFSAAVQGIDRGDRVTLKGPMGNLVYTGGADEVIFIVGGIGITPVRSILKYLTDKRVPGEKLLLYANQCVEETAFGEEIAQWEKQDPELDVIHILADPPEGWTGPTGFITREMLVDLIGDMSGKRFYVSGPPPMVECVVDCFTDLQIPREQLVTEELTGYEGMV